MAIDVCVIGATGAVGREMIHDLADSRLADVSLHAFASPRSAGQRLTLRGQEVTVRPFAVGDVPPGSWVLLSAGGDFSRANAEAIVNVARATVIDNSSAWRMHTHVPLIVPSVNVAALAQFRRPGIIANPNCSTIQLVMALEPLRVKFGLRSVHVATYQSVSGSGQQGIAELEAQTRGWVEDRAVAPAKYARPIFGNLIPAIDHLDAATGHSFEEVKMVLESRKIMAQEDLFITVTTVRVPVFNCHSEAVTVELDRDVTAAEATDALRGCDGIIVIDQHNYDALPSSDTLTGRREVAVARIRTPHGLERSRFVQMWIVADNLKVGAATNAVRILEALAA